MDVTSSANPHDLFSADGLVIVLTGGGTGIGLAMASALRSAKRLYILGRRLEKLEEAAKSLDPDGKVIVPLQCDITDNDSIKKVVQQVDSEIGYIDVLINNAGVLGPIHNQVNESKSIEDIQKVLLSEWDGWATTFAANTSAVIGVSASFLHLLDKGNQRRGIKLVEEKLTFGDSAAEGVDGDDKRSSQIITVASIAALNRFVTAGLAYTSSKAGALSLSKSLAHFLAPWGIRSNAICPGIFPSEMTVNNPPTYPYNKVPAGFPGEFGNIAGLILYLVGKAGAYLNGAVEVVDGGRLSVMPGTF